MEYCPQNLKNLLSIKPQIFERQSDEVMNIIEFYISCELFKELLECVQYLHDLKPQIIHRDLKPDNILIKPNILSGRFIKLGDFGLATVHDKAINYFTLEKHTTGGGTVKYQAPEIGQGSIYGHKCDIYSLALVGAEVFDFNLFALDWQK